MSTSNALGYGERLIAGTSHTGVVYDENSDGCTAYLNGEVLCWHRLADYCVRVLQRHGVDLSTTPAPVAPALPVEALPVEALPVEPVTVTERHAQKQTRCPWHSAIRYFFGQAKGAALDTKDESAMRQALAAHLGRAIASRSELTAGDWLLCGDAVKFGRLAW